MPPNDIIPVCYVVRHGQTILNKDKRFRGKGWNWVVDNSFCFANPLHDCSVMEPEVPTNPTSTPSTPYKFCCLLPHFGKRGIC